MQPLMGGMLASTWAKTDLTASGLEMSQFGAYTQTPPCSSLATSCFAVLLLRPERDSRTRFLAPLRKSHVAILFPMPPRPPETT